MDGVKDLGWGLLPPVALCNFSSLICWLWCSPWSLFLEGLCLSPSPPSYPHVSWSNRAQVPSSPLIVGFGSKWFRVESQCCGGMVRDRCIFEIKILLITLMRLKYSCPPSAPQYTFLSNVFQALVL